jgi:hypothetical protein
VVTETRVQLKGWPAVGLAVLAVAFLGYKIFVVRGSLGPEQLEDVRFWLQAEYSGRYIGDLREAVESGDAAGAEALAGEIQAMQGIEFVSIGARGTDEIVVRLEIEVEGQDPPDGERVRYFILEHSMLTGWRVKREAYWWSYYLKLF